MPPSDNSSRVKEYIDWAVRGAVGGLCAGSLAVIGWGFQVETRIHDLEQETDQDHSTLIALEAKETGYTELDKEIAVMQSKLDTQKEQIDHITKLLEAEASRK